MRGNLKATLQRLKAKIEGEEMARTGELVKATTRLDRQLETARVAVKPGLARPRGRTAWRALLAMQRWGSRPPPATRRTPSCARTTHAIIDELGTLTFAEVARAHERARQRAGSTPASARATAIAIMCRNHRGFIEATVAASKLGATCLYLNTAFAGPQLTDVVQREKPTALIYDEEFDELLEDAGKRRKRFVAWVRRRRRRPTRRSRS